MAGADQAKGRFRTFLLQALERSLSNEWEQVCALKRGGGQKCVPWSCETGETRYGAELAVLRTPEHMFERRWAVALLGEVMQQLEAEYQQGPSRVVRRTPAVPVGDHERLPYPQLATPSVESEGVVRVAVHRLRQRYQGLLRAEIAQTVASPHEVEAALGYFAQGRRGHAL